ncbi:uncharacterized protein LOC118814623 [Colossoma macropomum]|uniref:uncharacterized protein LOC118814623 n=1 Tax=Colossoma macropomum TaxID=42526 RepID=UPI00186423B4|nr:uncharacterized protein LOC118814623 [Colossoma macropomum]
MAALKPNVHQKPNLPPKPSLQSLQGPNSAHRPAALDRAIRRIEPGMVKQRALSLNAKQDGGGEGLNINGKMSSVPKAELQRSTGMVREQIQKLALPRERDEDKQKNEMTEPKEERKTWMKDKMTDHMEHGRSEPDRSEMEDSGCVARLEEEGSTTPPCPLQEKHCHCICHLQRPGMKLVWVPLQTEEKNDRTWAESERSQTSSGSLKREGESIKGETDGRRGETATYQTPPSRHTASVKSPRMPQCINCWSFLLHHSPQKLAESECIYESVEVLIHRLTPAVKPPSAPQEQQTDRPPMEEAVYLELLPSDENKPKPPTPPPRPPCPQSTSGPSTEPCGTPTARVSVM